MVALLLIHLIVPSVHYFPSHGKLVLSWFGFDWFADGGWTSFIQYAFVGAPAFVFIGLGTALPILLLTLVLLPTKVRSYARAVAYLLLSTVLMDVYLCGWFFYTWPLPYQPVQTVSIILFTLVAYKNWRQNPKQSGS